MRNKRATHDADKVYAVSELTRLIKALLEESFPSVWVEGEISNYKHHTSGHRYFSLKDERASLRCMIWRTSGRHLVFEPVDGQRVRAYGSLSVYLPQGSYQLVVTQLIDAGIGPLEIAFQKLKEKLQREGLFDSSRKRDLPVYPATVGVVTSSTGAAFVDITETIAQRFPGMRIMLAPVRVQGDGASQEIATAIEAFNRRADVDVLIVGRGGGSLEDLWPFNEEIVARAIAASGIPVISAVGHEVDFTIADGVADFRAPTPTGAAERVTDGWVRARNQFPQLSTRLTRAMAAYILTRRREWRALKGSHALQRPVDHLLHWAQRLDETGDRLTRAIQRRRGDLSRTYESLVGKLNTLSPEAVLRRGYSITRRCDDPRPLRDPTGLRPGVRLETTLSQGRLISEVTDLPSG